MKSPLLCLFLPIFLNGCFFPQDESPSAVDYLKSDENQTHHFRPVHRSHPEWTIGVLGKTLKLRTEGVQIRLNTRRNPNQVIVREDGQIAGHVEATKGNVSYINETDREKDTGTILLNCDTNKNVEIILNQQSFLYNLRSPEEMVSGNLSVKPLESKHRYSISEQLNVEGSSAACTGSELESPFNLLGTMIFHTDSLPLSARAAFAWYVTVFDFKCDTLSKQ